MFDNPATKPSPSETTTTENKSTDRIAYKFINHYDYGNLLTIQ